MEEPVYRVMIVWGDVNSMVTVLYLWGLSVIPVFTYKKVPSDIQIGLCFMAKECDENMHLTCIDMSLCV